MTQEHHCTSALVHCVCVHTCIYTIVHVYTHAYNNICVYTYVYPNCGTLHIDMYIRQMFHRVSYVQCIYMYMYNIYVHTMSCTDTLCV